MIAYDSNNEQEVTIKIGKAVFAEEMESLSFTVEALTEGNPNTTISFRLETGLPMRWIKYVERLCENIPNSYSIQREPSLG